MNIIHLVSDLGLGCTAKTAVNFAVGLNQLGHHVEVFALEGGEREGELNKHSVRFFIGTIEQFAKINYKDVHILHIHESGLPNEGTQYLLKKLPSSVNVIQTNIFGGFDEETHERINLRLFVSAATLLKYRLHGGKINKSHGVLYNPVQETHELVVKTSNSDSGDLIVGRIARPDILKWDYDFEILLKMLTRCGLKFKLRIVGAPQEVKNRLIQTGAQIEFVEKINSPEQLKEFYSSLDVLVHMSSIGESFGCIFVESMNFGVPVVTNSTPITKLRFWRDNAQVEIIDNGITGYICKNIVDMRNAIQLLASNPIGPISIRERSLVRFKTVNIIKQLDKFYKRTNASEIIRVDLEGLQAEHRRREENLFKTPFISINQRVNHKLEVATVFWLRSKRELKALIKYFLA